MRESSDTSSHHARAPAALIGAGVQVDVEHLGGKALRPLPVVADALLQTVQAAKRHQQVLELGELKVGGGHLSGQR